VLASAELSIDGVGDPGLKAPDRLEGLLARRWLASVVGLPVGVESDLADRGDVDHVVHPPVPGAGESVAVLLTGGRIECGGACPGSEAVAIGEPVHVSDIGTGRGIHHRADAADVHQM
jgi:hypothetical protein